MNVRRLSPRQKVLFYYYAFLRRAGESGLPRQPWMTPYEYSASLENLPDEQGENIASLTEGFIQARYSQHAVPEDLVGLIKTSWVKFRSFLRSRRAR